MSRTRTYLLELDIEIDDDTPDSLVEATLPNVVAYHPVPDVSTPGPGSDGSGIAAEGEAADRMSLLRFVGRRLPFEWPFHRRQRRPTAQELMGMDRSEFRAFLATTGLLDRTVQSLRKHDAV